ncbi:MAG: type II toxin-antitoxin system RelE/ParE family toxin [Propioniciclava sp.]|uniref:type II toxin-antitoxin system RelE/ParE family toxin n=1 Tax=Propioniciclava sp. TaxID=2038686 RepID=UPI0039E34B15
MSFRLVFVRRADEEYEHAIDWYLTEAPHEVERFISTVETTVEVIRERPLLPRVVYRELRNVKTPVFPYHLWYRVFEDIELVEIVAVLHGAQHWSHLERR